MNHESKRVKRESAVPALPALTVRDLGLTPYGRALEIQRQIVARIALGQTRDTLLLVEHPPVYTLGRNADDANILLPAAKLKQAGIEVAHTDRGGDVTFHGPGQLVGYPIIDLRRRGKGPVWYVGQLEEVLARTVRSFGVEAAGDRTHRGVWVGNEKIAAIGVRITRGMTMHGFALNVQTDLAYYRNIIPCGIRNRGVTSLHLHAPRADMPGVKNEVVRQFRIVFGYGEPGSVTPQPL